MSAVTATGATAGAAAGATGPSAEDPTAARAPVWRRPKLVFLGIVLAVLAAYTEMSFGLEWRTTAGRIGPGFFPRILGLAGVAMTLVALVVAFRAPDVEDEVVALEDEVGEGDLGKHPRLLALMVLASVVFAATLIGLGAIVSSALFLGLMLTMLNRAHPVANAVVAVGVPLVMYLMFQTLLNAGLPAGVLPFL